MDQFYLLFCNVIGQLGAQPESAWDLVKSSGLVVKAVLLILAFFSITSWGIIFRKWRQLHRARRQSENFMRIFWEGDKLSEIYEEAEYLTFSPAANIFRVGCQELRRRTKKDKAELSLMGEDSGMSIQVGAIDNMKRILDNAISEEERHLERGLSFLATTGSTAPFIGLFGTVWGIMDAFRAIGVLGSANLAVVAPGISEALIATAVGLFAAIPAVVAFNYFENSVRVISGDIRSFSSEFLGIAEKYLLQNK